MLGRSDLCRLIITFDRRNMCFKFIDLRISQIIGRVLRRIPSKHGHAHIEDYPELMLDAIKEAFNLVGPVKC